MSEADFPDQSQDIEAVRRAWQGCREEYTELREEHDATLRWSRRWKALAHQLRHDRNRVQRNFENVLEGHGRAMAALQTERDNLKFRLDLVTGDPETLEGRLLSKHNALQMASKNLDALREKYDRDISNANIEHQLELDAEKKRLDNALRAQKFFTDERFNEVALKYAEEAEAHDRTKTSLETLLADPPVRLPHAWAGDTVLIKALAQRIGRQRCANRKLQQAYNGALAEKQRLEREIVRGIDLFNAKVDELEAEKKAHAESDSTWSNQVTEFIVERAQLQAELARVKASFAELTQELEAAQRGERDAVEALDCNWVTHQRVVKAEAELAAARPVLELLEGMSLQVLRYNQTDTGWIGAVCRFELARRAAREEGKT